MVPLDTGPAFRRLTLFKWIVAALLVVGLLVGWLSGALVAPPAERVPGGAGPSSSTVTPIDLPKSQDPSPAPSAGRTAAGPALPSLTIERRPDGQLAVSGIAADAASRDQWLNAIRIGAQGARVQASVSVGPVSSAAPWSERLGQLTALAEDRRLDSIRLEGDRVVLRGPAVAGNYRRETENLFRAQLPERARVEYQAGSPAGSAGASRDRSTKESKESKEAAAPADAAKDDASASKDRAARGSAAAAPPAPPEPLSAPGTGPRDAPGRCPRRLESLAGHVYFKSDSAAVAEADEDRLARLGRCLRNRRVTVIGHADSRHSSEYNLTLSLKRAQAVAQIIRSNAPPTAIVASAAQGEGDGDKGARRESARQQRRVEIRIR